VGKGGNLDRLDVGAPCPTYSTIERDRGISPLIIPYYISDL